MKQSLTFLQYINNVAKDPFLSLEIRQKLNGQDLSFKRFLERVHTPNMNKQDAYDLLQTYHKIYEYDTQNVRNVLKDFPDLDEKEYLDDLNNHLQILELPTLKLKKKMIEYSEHCFNEPWMKNLNQDLLFRYWMKSNTDKVLILKVAGAKVLYKKTEYGLQSGFIQPMWKTRS